MSQIERIGKGVYGTIYYINDPSGPYILKVGKLDILKEEKIHKELYANMKKNAKCEGKMVKPLNKKVNNIVQMIDSEKYGYAMEYVAGDTLRDYLKKEKRITRIEKVMRKLRGALKCVWKAGYIHGDMHLGNVIVTHDEEIKIIDFGMTVKANNIPKRTEYGKWFKTQWLKVLKEHRIEKGNPNYVFFNKELIPFFAESDYNLLTVKTKKHTRSSVKNK